MGEKKRVKAVPIDSEATQDKNGEDVNESLTPDAPTTFAVRAYHQIRLDRHDNDVAPRRAFTMAARWSPELATQIQTRNGRDARTVITNLAEGEDVPTTSLGVAILWLEHAQRYYETTEPPFEGYRGPWSEAAADMAEAARWLHQIKLACAGFPDVVTATAPGE